MKMCRRRLVGGEMMKAFAEKEAMKALTWSRTMPMPDLPDNRERRRLRKALARKKSKQ